MAFSAGFIYIFIDIYRPGTVRVTRSARESVEAFDQCARPQSSQQVIAVYRELLSECKHVEHQFQRRFASYLVKGARGNFCIPVRDAIRALEAEASGFVVPRVSAKRGIQILPELQRRYRSYLRPDFNSICLAQHESLVYLETVRGLATGRREEILERTDLTGICGHDIPLAKSSRSEDGSARIVLPLDDHGLALHTNLFTSEARMAIFEEKQMA